MGWTGTAIPETLRRRRLRLPRAVRDRRGAGPQRGPDAVLLDDLPRRRGAAAGRAARRRSGGGCRGSRSGEAIGCLALAEGPAGADAAQALTTRAEGGAITGTKAPVADGDVADFAIVVARATAPAVLAVPRRPARRGRDARAPLATVDPTRSHARRSPSTARRPSRSARAGAGWPLAGARARPRGGARRLRAGRRRAGRARHGARVRRSAASPSAGPSPRSRRSSTSSPTCTWASSWRARTRTTRAWALSTDAPELPVAAAAARVSASEAYFHAAKENIQTHGGMGFTWEFDCHLHYRRAKLTGLMPGQRPPLERSADHAGSRRGARPEETRAWTSPTRREEAAFRAEVRALLERPRRAQARRVRDLAEPLSGTRGLGRARARQGLPAQARRRPGFAALHWPAEWGGRGAAADLPGDLRPGGDALPRPARLLRDRPRHVHADPVRLRAPRSRSAATPRPPCAATRCGASSSPSRAPAPTWPGLRTRARARRRRLGDQRPEDLDLGRALGGLGHPGRAQRSQGGQAQGPHLLLPRHEVAGHRDPADQADLRRVALQRGLLHRRAHPRQPAPRRGRRGLGRGHHHADERAPHLRRPARPRLRGDLRPRPRRPRSRTAPPSPTRRCASGWPTST